MLHEEHIESSACALACHNSHGCLHLLPFNNPSHLDSKLLQVEIVSHVIIHSFTDNLGSFFAVLLFPLLIPLLLTLHRFLLYD